MLFEPERVVCERPTFDLMTAMVATTDDGRAAGLRARALDENVTTKLFTRRIRLKREWDGLKTEKRAELF